MGGEGDGHGVSPPPQRMMNGRLRGPVVHGGRVGGRAHSPVLCLELAIAPRAALEESFKKTKTTRCPGTFHGKIHTKWSKEIWHFSASADRRRGEKLIDGLVEPSPIHPSHQKM